MKDIELKLTTASALAFEEATGKGILETLGEIAQAAAQKSYPKLQTIVNIFCAMGEGYTSETFDKWDVPLLDKISAVSEAAERYILGKNAKPVSANSSKSATHTA